MIPIILDPTFLLPFLTYFVFFYFVSQGDINDVIKKHEEIIAQTAARNA